MSEGRKTFRGADVEETGRWRLKNLRQTVVRGSSKAGLLWWWWWWWGKPVSSTNHHITLKIQKQSLKFAYTSLTVLYSFFLFAEKILAPKTEFSVCICKPMGTMQTCVTGPL